MSGPGTTCWTWAAEQVNWLAPRRLPVLRVTGCDISAQMLKHASERDRDGRVAWVRLDPAWQRLPFAAAAFDAIMAASVLEYVADPLLVLRECARVLRRGAVLLCTVPDPRHPVRRLERAAITVTGALPSPLADRCPGRPGRYLTYLQISQHRHPASWWYSAGRQVGLSPVRGDSVGRATPLQLLTFRSVRSGGVR